MFDDLHAYYHEHVLTAFRDFRDLLRENRAGQSKDLRAAVAACNALFHLLEHLPAEHRVKRAFVEQQCPSFAIVGDIANVAKHRNITKPTPHGAPLVSSADQLEEVLLVIEYEDDEGAYRGTRKQVRATLTDGRQIDVLCEVTNVLNFWEKFLASAGVLKEARHFAFDDGLGFRTRDDCKSGPTLQVIQGVRFRQLLQLMKYNKETGRAEVMPLPEGSQVNMELRERSRHTLEISLKNDKTGQEFQGAVTLSVEESEAVDDLPEADRAAFLNALPRVQAAYRELATQAGLLPAKPA